MTFDPSSGSSAQGLAPIQQNAVRYLGQIVTLLGQIFPLAIGTATTATAGSATLPAAPATFLIVKDPATGVEYKIPAYNP